MKVSKQVGNMTIEAEGETIKEVFAELARMEEVFGEQKCGKCGCGELKFIVRNIDDNLYHELCCTNYNCRAKLSYGVHKKGGGLFPKRKDDKEVYLPNGGWLKWNKDKQINE